jgi:hypothetical protein
MFSLGSSTSLATLMLLVDREGAKDLPFLEDLALFECECGLLDDPKNEKLISYWKQVNVINIETYYPSFYGVYKKQGCRECALQKRPIVEQSLQKCATS